MFWDVPHHRGSGFPLHVLRPTGVFSILSSLYQNPHLRPADLANMLAAANTADAPLMGMRDLSGGISGLLSHLRNAGLVVRCAAPGPRTRYDLTRLGAGLVGSLEPLTQWALAEFDFVAAATRVRMGLPPLVGPVPPPIRHPRAAAGMAVGLTDGLWTHTVLVYVDSAGPDGIGPLRLEDTVNAAIDASAGPDRVARHLQRPTLHSVLKHLVAMGLLERREEPPRVPYRLSPQGRGLMDALWQVAEGWGIEHDAELFEIMRKSSGWFRRPSGG